MTNIELDHVDYYKDLEDIKSAYLEFGNKAGKQIIACGDDLNIRSLNFDKPILYYGFNDNNDVIASNIEYLDIGSSFDVHIKGELIGRFTLPIYGKHMILNSLSIISLSYLLNLDMDKVKEIFMTFKGAKRRFSIKTVGDNILIDDYAHHPTEVRVTIETAKLKYPDKTIVAVFKPNTYSRTKVLYKEFAEALNIADKAYVTDIFCEREKPEEWPGITSKLILDGLNNGESISVDTVDKLLNYHNSVIIFMSCRDIYVLQEKYEALLSN
jgi:UDP-N-acetylmuramate--alanine ligase